MAGNNKITPKQALRGGKYILRKKKDQKGMSKDEKKTGNELIAEGHSLAKDGKLNNKGDLYKYA
jgi:hypothetical protein